MIHLGQIHDNRFRLQGKKVRVHKHKHANIPVFFQVVHPAGFRLEDYERRYYTCVLFWLQNQSTLSIKHEVFSASRQNCLERCSLSAGGLFDASDIPYSPALLAFLHYEPLWNPVLVLPSVVGTDSCTVVWDPQIHKSKQIRLGNESKPNEAKAPLSSAPFT